MARGRPRRTDTTEDSAQSAERRQALQQEQEVAIARQPVTDKHGVAVRPGDVVSYWAAAYKEQRTAKVVGVKPEFHWTSDRRGTTAERNILLDHISLEFWARLGGIHGDRVSIIQHGCYSPDCELIGDPDDRHRWLEDQLDLQLMALDEEEAMMTVRRKEIERERQRLIRDRARPREVSDE